MSRIVVIASLVFVASCAERSAADGGEVAKVREDVAEIHKELRDLRDEQRALRAEIRELRESAGDTVATVDTDDDEPTAEKKDDDAAKPVDTTPPIKSQPAKQENVRISIASNPKGAKVYIAGKVMGRTPVLLERAPGSDTIDIRVEKEGYRLRILTVRPEEDTKLSVQLAKK